ncbi:Prolyl oligopeptidase family protein [Modicisalibacter ilicicola DSM 19980]|uniref:Prolyl oligopeptidase family protein n=1 Tax=Modicisalibacter ilicicola DSM 19980 TaxID=1121942 RepID=A0A1M4YY82_9GAMM|nr:alpha/beta hydrolase [Halomonas ilicicola]SHF10789.1 Prolyl oligopeptidase family protein [Halomonas ilicicola DSM 19980]
MRGSWMLLALLFALNGCTTHLNAPEPPTDASLPGAESFEVLEGLTYTPVDWPEVLKADVYLPATPGTARRPAALVVHGGGWQGRSRDDMADIAKRLARRGIVAVNVTYRFAPQYKFPAQLHDLQQAMAWIHENADAWRVDTSRIAGVGYSSGAHLVSLLALVASDGGELNDPHGGEEARLDAVVAGGTPTNLFKFDDGRLVVQFLGGTRLEVPMQYARASPTEHITPDAPPFFLFHGTWDGLVPVDHAEDFHAALGEAGVYSELYLLRYRGHITTFLTRGNAMEAAMDFLARELGD